MIGEITEKSKYFQHDNYLDITDGIVFNKVDFPELYNTTRSSDLSDIVLRQEINNPSPSINDYFGWGVSMYGDTLVVGAYGESTGASAAGAVYVYTRSGTTWTFEQEINNPSPVATDYFGSAVSVYGDTLVVGAGYEDTGADNAGSVYVYTRSGTTWTLEQEINNPSPVIADFFGASVSLYGDTLVVGASYEDTGADGAGSVYVYTRSGTTWTLQQEINNPSPALDDHFGGNVSVYGDTLVAGAYGESTGASAAGSVYVYTRSGTTWTLEQEINNPSPVASDNFGYKVSLYGDTLVATANLEDTGAIDTGSVYVYTRSGTTWTLEQEINNPSPVASDNFGISVSLYGDTLVVGANLEDTGADAAGSVYVYTRSGTTWTLQQEINNPSPVASDYFGRSVFVYGDTLVAGAVYEDTGADNAGSVYVYDIPLYDFSLIDLEQEINNPSPVSFDSFGQSVSVYGDTLVTGAYQEDTGAADAGSVYVYTRSGTTWTLEQEINNPSPVSFDRFGISVSVYGDTLVIGANLEDTGADAAGSVYVYTRSGTTWTLQQEINNPTPVASDNFGWSVSVYGDTLVVGAYLEDTGASAAGSVYVYTRSGTTWTLQQEINNPSPVSFDNFGYSVSVYGDTLLTGAYQEDTGADAAGSVYVYTRSGTTWTLEQEINNPSPVASDQFGRSVSLYGDTLVAGAHLEDTGADAAGSVYVYTRSGTTWTLQQEINNPSPVISDYFGRSVSVYDDALVVGAYGEDTGADAAGSVYVYTRSGTTWTLQQEINNPTPVASDYFGYSVSVYGDTLVAGAYGEGTGATGAGSVYVYKAPGFGAGEIPPKKTNNDTTKFFIQVKENI